MSLTSWSRNLVFCITQAILDAQLIDGSIGHQRKLLQFPILHPSPYFEILGPLGRKIDDSLISSDLQHSGM